MRITGFIFLIFLFSAVQAQTDKALAGATLIAAAEQGKTETVIQILKTKPDIDFRDDMGGTALFYATQNHHLDIVKILVYNGADMNLGLYDGFTPLMSAAYTGDFDIAEYLAYSGADLDAQDQYGATALLYAIAQGDFAIADMLLFYGADPERKTVYQTNALTLAAMVGDTAIARRLLAKKLNPDAANKYGYNPLKTAIINNDTAMFDLLIAAGAKPEQMPLKKYKPYAWSLLNENSYAFERLEPERPGAEAFSNKETNPLILAYFYNDRPLVQKLKAKGYTAGILPYYSTLTVDAAFVFNNKDIFFDIGLGATDIKYKTAVHLSYGTRFKEKAILRETDYGLEQLWEHRRYFDFALEKYFIVPMGNADLQPYVQLSARWMFGSYDGLSRKLDYPFALVPRVGIRLVRDNLQLNIAYEYSDYNLYEIAPHKIVLGVGYRINFIRKPKTFQLIWL